MTSSIRGAAEFPALLESPLSPSAANGPVLAQVEGEELWGPSGGFPSWPHACCCGCCSARALPPRCVLACFYNKDNSTASCHFSSLSLVGGMCKSLLLLVTRRPLGSKRAWRPQGCICCRKCHAKMSDPERKSVVWVS